MAKKSFAGKRIAVIGLGKEGLDLVMFLHREGAQVMVLDKSTPKALGANYTVAKKAGANFNLGAHYLADLARFDIIFRSPGVPLDTPALKAVAKKVPMSSAIRLFMERCPAKMVGITGTKGKSTTTALVYHLFKGHKRVWLAGNIGVAPLQLLTKLKKSDIVVLELSSFQLEDVRMSPHVAVLLNVVPEHLDRHGTFAKYLKAKQNIFTHQGKSDWLVASRDFEVTREALKKSRAKKFGYSTRKVLDRGLYLAKDKIVYRDVRTGKRREVIDRKEVSLLGEHNLQNILPAVAVALTQRVPLKHIVKKLKTFKSLPHRLEFVREKKGVLFVNDSLGTTPEAAIAATESFAYTNVALIVGGVYKGGDIDALAKAAQKHGVRFVALIGKSTPLFYKSFKRYAPDVKTEGFPHLRAAIKGGFGAVKDRGGVVILAPAAASFDMFKNAYERGDQFRDLVKRL
ncbi:MAG: UDP-N-acetylmuramoyl-L-alanine--D-glutamate ligase [Patescibacteria group bacterium]|nr:UDP-N-acetylmuramoyl-L-alanine--D-glutamate ligase [Patescibacteria group bacterium]